MAFNDTYRESIQTKHLANVGFTSTAKGVTNEAFALVNPHQVLASQIPSIDVVGTYGPLVADGISAGLVEKHTVKLTADPTVNNNKAWVATEDNCTEAGHSARGALRLGQWMRYAGTQYKLRLYEDTGANAPDYTAEILPSEVSFNWEYDASAGVVYFDADPSGFSKTLPLWGELFTYTGESVADSLSTTTSGLTAHNHVEADITDLDKYTQAEVDTISGSLQIQITSNDVDIASLEEIHELTQEPTGFVGGLVQDSVLSRTFTNGTRTFEIEPASSSYNFYVRGVKFTKTGTDSYQIPDTEGLHYIFFDNTGTLSGTVGTFDPNILFDGAYVNYLYWDKDNQRQIIFGRESHRANMNPLVHAYLHETRGAVLESGGALGNIVSEGDGSSNTHCQFSVEASVLWDEDLRNSLIARAYTENISVYYREGADASNIWRAVESGSFPVASGTSGRAAYNRNNAGTWELTNVPDGDYVLAHVFAFNDLSRKFGVVVGQATYNDITSARDGAETEVANLNLLGTAVQERKFLGTLIIQTSDTYTNDVKSRIRTTVTGDDYIDLRTYVFPAGGETANVVDHGVLAGLLDDDHPQYLNIARGDARYYTETEIDLTVSGINSTISTTSGTLQSEIDGKSDIGHNHDSSYDALGAASSAVSGHELTWDHDSFATHTEVSTVSGVLQDQIDNLDLNFATDAELASVSGSLHTEIINNYNTLDGKIDTTSGTLQGEIDALDSSLTGAIIWEVVDTPYDQIRPKAEHMGKAIYTSGNLTIGGDLTVSGTTTTIHSQELTVTDKIITVNDGEIGAGITGSPYAGIEVDRGSETNYLFVFDEVQDNFRVGISGSLQAVATREDTPTDGYVAIWNAAEYRFDTSTSIALGDLATDAELSAVSGTLQSAIGAVALDLSSNYYTITQLDSGQLDNRYYTETEIDLMFSSASGTLQSQIDALDDKIDTTSGTLQSEIDDLDSKIDTVSGTLQLEINAVALDLSTNYYTSNQVDTLLTSYSTTAEITNLLAAQDSFLELNDTIDVYNSSRILFTTASGVIDDAALTFDYVTGTLNVTGIQLGTGGVVNEIVTTVTSGTTNSQIPTAKAVWDLTEAAAAAVHTHFDVDADYVSDTTWTYGSSFSGLPDNLTVYINGMKNRIGVDNDYTADVAGGILTLTFTYKVKSDFWVNITYTE